MTRRISNLVGTFMFVVLLVSAVTGIGAVLAIGFLAFQYLFSLLFGA